jgi:hypothetical protein
MAHDDHGDHFCDDELCVLSLGASIAGVPSRRVHGRPSAAPTDPALSSPNSFPRTTAAGTCSVAASNPIAAVADSAAETKAYSSGGASGS